MEVPTQISSCAEYLYNKILNAVRSVINIVVPSSLESASNRSIICFSNLKPFVDPSFVKIAGRCLSAGKSKSTEPLSLDFQYLILLSRNSPLIISFCQIA